MIKRKSTFLIKSVIVNVFYYEQFIIVVIIIIIIIIIIINTGLSLSFQVAGLSGKVASNLSHKSSCNCYV